MYCFLLERVGNSLIMRRLIFEQTGGDVHDAVQQSVGRLPLGLS